MKKNYGSAPLPFQGQKRNFIKQFKEALKTYPEDAVYVDLFGGSGLLSHTVKQEKPKEKVIYNDYDSFKNRIAAIPKTNNILRKLRQLLSDYPRSKKINGDKRKAVLELLKLENNKGYVDFITISSSILFSMNYVQTYEELEKQTFYNRIRKSDFNAEGYLNNVEFVYGEYKEVFKQYKNVPNVVFLVDPPYLSTDCTTYKNYWKLTDYLDVLKVLYSNNYFYFTSNKSSVIELCKWIENNTGGVNPFNKAKVVYQYNKTTHNTGYTDIMLHKCYTTDTTL
ncbi:DNA adenine methylase [Tenacibaculum maritimum]|nr:DNA adenine methylase [Tenacibaculum maritimum]MDB0599648.1 DNA adenine methylase [Tenacibaculum maritimum]MDB0599777.1 DNA adenine methylase [Tenacibaculum maritimum]MDB0599999.1 DNA adenine methylase [Tenacibaculum maritimum]MDB0600678.1 DNA adenine methylase [Tenacibaculum maritimum]MDB0610737.1 DNA adenine methylase [Tenacibaculum maritimum]